MNQNTPTPKHGDKQTTDKGNLLVCIHFPGEPRKFFYMTPEGKYIPHKFSVNNRQFLTKTEWNFLYGKTGKVEQMLPEEVKIAEDLFFYIVQDVTAQWDIKTIKEGVQALANKSLTETNTFANIKGFEKLIAAFA